MNPLTLAEQHAVRSNLRGDLYVMFLDGHLHPFDALVAAKLPKPRQRAFAEKCMRGFNVVMPSWSQCYKYAEKIDGTQLRPSRER